MGVNGTLVRGGLKLGSGLGVARLVAAAFGLLLTTAALALPPTIELVGDNPLTVLQGQPFVDPGATADDPEEGDLTDEIIITTPPINTNIPGTYVVTYEVTDSEPIPNTVSVDRTVVVDAVPSISIIGANPLTVAQGGPYDPNNPGATADDLEDGDLTDQITVDNPVNTGVPGSYSVTYSVTDSAGNSAAEVRTVIVNGPPSFSSTPVLMASEGVAYQYNVTTSDPENDPRNVTAVTVPAWLTFTPQANGAAQLQGTPAGADVGDHAVEIRVSDSVNPPVSQSFTIMVSAGAGVPTITILGDNPLTVLQGQAYDPTNPGATADDPEDGDLTASILIDNPVDTGVPGSYTVTYSVTDSAGNNAAETRTVIVNGPPVFSSAPILTATEAVEYLYDLTASDAEGDPLTITPVIVPAWLTFTSTGTDTAELRGTPAGVDVGDHPVEIQVTDSLNPAVSQVFTITVTAGAGVPEITLNGDPTVTIQQGDPYADEGATASDLEDGDLTDQIVVTNPVNSATPGTYTVTYTATDSAGNAGTAERTVIVNGAPRFDSAPVTSADEDALYSYNIATSDPNVDDTITITASCTGPDNDACLQPTDWLSFQDNGDGTALLSGTPTQADVGTWDLELQAADQTGAAGTPQVFTITVVNVNDAPLLETPLGDQSAVEDTPATFSVAGSFSDEDGDTLSYDAAGLPPSFSIDPVTGEISGVAGDVDVLTAPVTLYDVVVTASDALESVAAGFVLSVENVNDLPVLLGELVPLSTDEDVDIQITPANLDIEDPDPGEMFMVELSAGANYTLIGDGTRVLPDPDYSGPLTVTTTVQDSGGAVSNAIELAITVLPVNDPPSGAIIDPQTATENVPFTLDAAPFFSDVEGDELSFDASGLPPGLTIDSAGLISGTPALDISVGDYSVELTVSDGSDVLITSFGLSVLRAGRADLAVDVAATPSAAVINESTDWSITITNNAPQVEVATIALQVVFSGPVPFALDDPADAACALTTSTQVDCTLGPVGGGGSITVTISGAGDQVGDVVADATVSIPDPTPIDETSGNDSDRGSLSLAESVSAGSAQQIGAAALASAAADLDSDGFVDLAVGTVSGIRLHLNIPDPNNEDKRILDAQGLSRGAAGATNDVAAADLDDDGDMDLVAANGPGTAVEFLFNAGDASFESVRLGNSNDASNAVALGDINGDLLIDAVIANSSPNRVYINQGSGVFQRTQSVGNADSVDVVLADVLGDALPEMIVANSNGDAAIYRNSGGTFEEPPLTLPTGAATAVAAGDFDGDGLTDLVFAKASSVGGALPANPVYRNMGGGAFDETGLLGAAPTVDVLVRDVNLDGLLDIVTLNGTGAHQIYAGDGAGAFVLHPQQFAASGARRGGFGDVNGDGRDDLAISGALGSDIFFNDGRGNLGAGDITPPTIQLVGAADVQLDVGDEYVDEGATASDDVDGDISANIVTDNPVDTAVVGTYRVSYDVIDNSGNAATTVTRSVSVGVITGRGGGGGGASGLFSLLLLILAWLPARITTQRQRRSVL